MATLRPIRTLILCTCLVLAGLGAAYAGNNPTLNAISNVRPSGCVPGTVVGGPNLITNGSFATPLTTTPGTKPQQSNGDPFDSDLSYVGRDLYPGDGQGIDNFTILTGALVPGLPSQVVGKPFPGDPQRETPATATYYYSNPSWDGHSPDSNPYVLWRQTINGLLPNTSYNFFAYFDNLLSSGVNSADPVIELRVDGQITGPAITVPKSPDVWVPVQFAFTTGDATTSVVLEVIDKTGSRIGGDFGMTQLNLKQCVTGLGVAKLAKPVVGNEDGSYTVEYLITVRSYGFSGEQLNQLQVSDDLAQTFAAAASFSIVSLTSPTLSVNPSFNGTTDKNLLVGSVDFPAQQTATITLVVKVWSGSGEAGHGPFNNIAVATAKAGGITVTDISVPGTDPDPDGDGDPREGGVTPTKTLLGSRIGLPLLHR